MIVLYVGILYFTQRCNTSSVSVCVCVCVIVLYVVYAILRGVLLIECVIVLYVEVWDPIHTLCPR